jgi:RHS repeat-associated protein
MMRAVCAVVGLGALAASAQTATSLDAKVQAPKLSAPEKGSLVGQFASTVFGPADVSRGGFHLPSPLGLPSERGGPLAGVLPGYSAESGLTEWGLGWQTSLALTRSRVVGDLDYATDELTGPWGRMVRGQDGDWYPLGLSSNVRLREQSNGWVAYLPDGTRWTFGLESRVDTAKGTYAWYLDEVQTVLGRKMRLEYEKNTSGRPFLKAVHYGGTGEDFQYRADFVYEPVAETVRDLRSGQALVLDKRVKNVVAFVRNAQTGVFEERWRETLTYEDDTLGPAFYLTGVQRTYASGEKAPAVTYRYYKPEEQLAQTALRRNSRLDGVLTQFGADATQPNKATLLDINLDGRLDLEHHYDNTLLVQGDTGFTADPLPPSVPGTSALCRPAPSTLNQPRTWAQMRASEDAHQVVALRANTYRTETTFEVCDRAGFSMATQTLSGDWTLGANVRLVDINRDRQPDLVKVSSGRATILPNTSSGAGFSFGAAKVATLSSVAPFTPNTSWVHDLNGDGVADIIARGGSGSLTVWMGKGDFSFEAAKSFQFLGSTGVPLSSLTDYQVTFLDANKDGLSDVLLTRATGSGSYLYTNTGTGFTQRQVPALAAMTGTIGRPVVVDFAGTGDTEVAYVISNQAHSLALDAPQSALMRSADDGKGTVLGFEYGRGAPEPGVYGRPVVLSAMTVASSGYDTVRYTYDYAQPTLHSVGRFLIGYNRVVRQDPLVRHAVDFLNEDRYAGVLLASSKHDTLSPALDSFESLTYEERVFQGIPWKRLKEQVQGWKSTGGAQSVELSERAEYLAYHQEVCPSKVRQTSVHGVVVTDTRYVQPPNLSLHLTCLSENIVQTGTHTDPSLDFRHETALQRNARGQVEHVRSVTPGGALDIQAVTYNTAQLVDSITVPGQGTSTFSYAASTLLLKRAERADGLVTEVTDVDPRTDATRAIRTTRGTLSMQQFFRFDGQERLRSQWDDQGGATELNPNQRYSYRYATATHPGSIFRSQLIDATAGIASDTVEFSTAAGEALTTAHRIPEGWTFGPLVKHVRNQSESSSYFRPLVGPGVDPTGLDHAALMQGAWQVGRTTGSAFGHEVEALEQFHANVSRHTSTSLGLQGDRLVETELENGTLPTRQELDAARRVLAYTDAAGNRYAYVHDALGRLRAVQLPDGKTHHVQYDGHGRVSRVERQGVATIDYAYDATTGLPSLKTFRTPEGVAQRTVSWSYDSVGRVRQELYTDLTTDQSRHFTYYYDGATPEQPQARTTLSLLTAVVGEGFTKHFEHRADGSLLRRRVTFPGWRTVETEFAHFDTGLVRTQTTRVFGPSGELLSDDSRSQLRDEWGRVSGFTLNGAPFVTYTYDTNDQLSTATFATGDALTMVYDPATRRFTSSTQTHCDGGAAGCAAWQSTSGIRLNARGFVDAEQLTVGTLSLLRQFDYSAEGFLKRSTDAEASYAYGFDATGLPTRIEDGADVRHITRESGTISDGTTFYELDGLGRVTQRGDWHYAYDAAGHLEHASDGSVTWSFLYDETGRRLLKRSGSFPVAAYLEEGFLDASGLSEPVKVAGRPVGLLKNGTFQFLATDFRGSVMADLDGSANLASPFGVRSQSPSLSAALDYVQHGRDPDLGLIRMGVRDYDPALNQFLTPDPAFLESPQLCVGRAHECNLYGYAAGNPVHQMDAQGTWVHMVPLIAQRLTPYAERISRAATPYINRAYEVLRPHAVTAVNAASRYGQQAVNAARPHAVRMMQVASDKVSHLYNVATRAANTQQGQELIQTTIEVVTGADTGVSVVPTAAVSSQLDNAVKAVVPPAKFKYFFGLATGRDHNLERSNQNALQMGRLGLFDNAQGHAILTEHLQQAATRADNVLREFSNKYGNFEVRESLFAGPSGKFSLIESTWSVAEDGTRTLSTIIPKGGVWKGIVQEAGEAK